MESESSSSKESEAGSGTKIQAAYFAGPLPPPSLLEKYNDIIPDGAERILAMAERQSAHRESLELQIVAGNLSAQTRGSYFAFFIAMAAILGGILLIYKGRDVYGFASIVTSIAALAAVFIYSKKEQGAERSEKASALESRRKPK